MDPAQINQPTNQSILMREEGGKGKGQWNEHMDPGETVVMVS
jgi:hypothetical protein